LGSDEPFGGKTGSREKSREIGYPFEVDLVGDSYSLYPRWRTVLNQSQLENA